MIKFLNISNKKIIIRNYYVTCISVLRNKVKNFEFNLYVYACMLSYNII